MAKLDIQDVPQKPVSDLRARVIRGGAAIAIRQCLGMGLSVVSVLLVTRIIGPYQYGIFAAVYGIAAFIATAATWGLDVYLLRKAAEPTSAEYDQAFTLFTATSVFFVGGLTLFRHSISRFAGLPEIASPLAIMSLFIPSNLLNNPGVVRLDRTLKFQRVAVIELAGQANWLRWFSHEVEGADHGMENLIDADRNEVQRDVENRSGYQSSVIYP
jgi:O-antigen/teichoic acid export membrane protein